MTYEIDAKTAAELMQRAAQDQREAAGRDALDAVKRVLAWPTQPVITVWRTVSKDPDRDEDFTGTLDRETADAFYIVSPINMQPQRFSKSVWRESGRSA